MLPVEMIWLDVPPEVSMCPAEGRLAMMRSSQSEQTSEKKCDNSALVVACGVAQGRGAKCAIQLVRAASVEEHPDGRQRIAAERQQTVCSDACGTSSQGPRVPQQ